MLRLISTWATAAFVLVGALTLTGCSGGGKGTDQPPAAKSVRAEDLVGKWRLVRAGGNSPRESWIKSREIDLAADGTWKATVVGAGQVLRGMTQTCGGTWSLADGVVTYTNGAPEAFKSRVKVEAGRLVVDPDFIMGIRKKGPAVTGEYERSSADGTKDQEDLMAARKKEEDLVTAMKFVKVPRGTFWMGWDSDQKQSKQVEIKEDFELAAYAVTQGQWQALMGNNPSEFSRHGANSGMVMDMDDVDLLRFPVENVSWNDVQEFLKKLNEREKGKGWRYRLPSEAEWEYACRGAATTKEECSFDFYLGKPTNDLSSKDANFAEQRPDGNRGGLLGALSSNVTVKVGSYVPNKLGLYDMHGNVQQWCDDLADPQGTERVTRGGNWGWGAQGCRAAERVGDDPSHRRNYCGFRVARVVSGSK